MRKEHSKYPLVFIFVAILIDCIGMRIIYPVSATIIAEVSKSDVTEAVSYNGWMMAAYAIMQFIFAPILGALSDRYGRRPVLLLSLFGLGLDYLFLSLATTLPLLFVGRIISGICGASLTAGFAYVADVSPIEKRAKNFGLISAAIGLGFIIGPFLGGLLSEFGSRVPFVAAACLSLLNWLYGFFILPESLPKEKRRPFLFKRANPFGSFKQIHVNKDIRNYLLVLFLLFLAAQVMPSIWPFYTKYRYQWSDLQIGYSLAFVGILVSIVKAGMVEGTVTKMGKKGAIYFGLVFNFSGLLLFAFSTESWMVYVVAIVYCLGGVTQPLLQGIISSKVNDNHQGELQGMITSLLSLANIISPLLMTHLFQFFIVGPQQFHFSGAAFVAAAVLVFIGFLLLVRIFRTKIK